MRARFVVLWFSLPFGECLHRGCCLVEGEHGRSIVPLGQAALSRSNRERDFSLSQGAIQATRSAEQMPSWHEGWYMD